MQQPQPGATVTDRAELGLPLKDIRATFIAQEGWLAHSREGERLDRLKSSPNWRFDYIEGGHWPMLTAPRQLVRLLVGSVR